MRFIKYVILLLTAIVITACEDNSVSFGTVEYYPSFLWSKANISPVTKTFEFDFSQDAQNDKKSYAEFQFVDNDGKPMSTNIMQVSIDGTLLKNNKFKVTSDTKSKDITFTFNPEAKNAKYQGYLKLISHRLDRLDSQTLTPGQKIDAFQWTIYYDKGMNPLAKVIMWISIIIASCLIIWFLLLRPLFFPHFGKFTKSILLQKDGVIVGQMNFAFKGARKVVFYNQKVKQSFWERLFIGEIRTLVNPNFTTKLTFSPRKRNAVAYGTGYSVKSNPILRSGIATINHIQQKLTITLR